MQRLPIDNNSQATNKLLDIESLEPRKPEEDYIPDFLKFDIVHLIKSLFSKFFIMAIVGIIFGIAALFLVKSKFGTTCVLIKSAETSSIDRMIPSYGASNTILNIIEALDTRENRQKTIDRLELPFSEKALHRMMKISIGKVTQKHKIDTNLIKISVTHEDNRMAADIANTFAEVFIESRALKQDINEQKVLNYFVKKKNEISDEIIKIQEEEASFKKRYGIAASLEPQITSKYNEMENLKNQLIEKEMEILTVKEEDKKKLIELNEELSRLKSKYTDDNVKIKEIKDEIAYLQEQIKESGTVIEDSSKYEMKIDIIKKQIQVLKKRINEKDYEIKRLSEIQEQHNLITGKIEINRELIASLEQKITDQRSKMHASINDLEILERAIIPESASPGKSAKLLIGCILGGGLTFVILLILELFNFSVKSQYDFDNIFYIKMITKVPYVDKKRKKKKKLWKQFFSSLHLINDHLYNSDPGQKIISVGSDIPRAGKTYLTRSLIKLLASQGKKILYISSRRSIKKINERKDAVINPYLYGLTENTIKPLLVSKNFYQCYFHVNKDIYGKIMDKSRIESLIKSQGEYDYIFWELFDPGKNLLSFVNIVLNSDIFLITAKFRKSKREGINKIIELLYEKRFKNIFGILNYVHEFYL